MKLIAPTPRTTPVAARNTVKISPVSKLFLRSEDMTKAGIVR
jgi:hypothetical protein